ncbi:hypothetical protein AMS58_19905 [Pseudoalteromonas porphyrae]|uniref:Uncharacterized protein n=2 Tax=Pseudoalteromonas TaxID=53246 RepID=A0A0N1MUF2_9GAMM|nr:MULTISPECIES: hypothetical protein [Pseudoalteromonas]KPH64645.1 hypothetical protein ADS77_05060 [Pseudoalteromonas porphyrae]KPH92966.1 hypothetical protein AMS58_19905 [Pseudoalteromonas porphyrae]
MSYDLMVFDAEQAPRELEIFSDWYDDQSEWAEEHDYDDPSVTTDKLRLFFMELINDFPPMNGPFAKELEDDTLADICVGKVVVYVGFAWSQSEPAFEKMFSLAKKYSLGFLNASSERGEVWFPNTQGELEICFELSDIT